MANASFLEEIIAALPVQHARALEWFVAHEGEIGPRPWRVGGRSPVPGVDIPLVAQRGIHQPRGWSLALSITATTASMYLDGMRTQVDQDTWVLPYREHSGGDGTGLRSRWNRALDRNRFERVPVGVFVPAGRQYLNLGLAMVESYDETSGTFLLRGPVRFAQPETTWAPSDEEPASVDFQLMAAESEPDERYSVLARRRRSQDRFRDELLAAYGGECAVTGYDAVEALQGAHILAYSGRSSQLVTNGILMRADVHLLFDRHLLSVNPDHWEVALSPAVRQSAYGELHGAGIRLPRRTEQHPSLEKLAVHWAVFEKAVANVN